MLNSLKEMLLPEKLFLLGVVIDNHTIKMAEVSGKNKQIVKTETIAAPEGAIEDGRIIQMNPVADALGMLWKQGGFSSRRAAALVPGKEVITRFITLPRMSESEVSATLKWEADKYLPLAKEKDLFYSHLILDQSTGDQAPQIQVLLAAVSRQVAERVHQTFSLAGLELRALEIAPLAIWRSMGNGFLPSPKEGGPLLLVLEIGGQESHLLFLLQGKLIFSRYIPLGASFISDTNDCTTELKKSFVPLWDEIRRCLEFFSAQFKMGVPEGMIIIGEGAKIRGLSGCFQDELGITLWQNQKPLYGPEFSIAVGLALRGRDR